jgi:hypothetical protein
MGRLTIGELIDESLEFYGIKSRDDALALVRRARARVAAGTNPPLFAGEVAVLISSAPEVQMAP